MDYAVGDVQGCFEALKSLLAHIKFSTDKDRLFFLGDVVNRGKNSLKTLTFIRDLKDNAKVILGNHDMYLIVCAYDRRKLKAGDNISQILDDKKSMLLIDFLRKQPLIIKHDKQILVHAGIPPQWKVEEAMRYARAIELELSHDNHEKLKDFLEKIYHNEPSTWSFTLKNHLKWRYTVNALLRMRFCTSLGKLEFKHKGSQKQAPKGFKAWFEHKDNNIADYDIIFGHWSSLKSQEMQKYTHIFALDSGCVWGRRLSAICLDNYQISSVPC